MPHVARHETPPDDWGAGWAESKAWERGYLHTADGLVCRECGALLPHTMKMQGAATLTTPEQRHDDWHANQR